MTIILKLIKSSMKSITNKECQLCFCHVESEEILVLWNRFLFPIF
jgi:hypothetical protein